GLAEAYRAQGRTAEADALLGRFDVAKAAPPPPAAPLSTSNTAPYPIVPTAAAPAPDFAFDEFEIELSAEPAAPAPPPAAPPGPRAPEPAPPADVPREVEWVELPPDAPMPSPTLADDLAIGFSRSDLHTSPAPMEHRQAASLPPMPSDSEFVS